MASAHTTRGVRPTRVELGSLECQAAELGPCSVGVETEDVKGAEQAGDRVPGGGLSTYRLWPRSLERGPGDVFAAGYT